MKNRQINMVKQVNDEKKWEKNVLEMYWKAISFSTILADHGICCFSR